MFFLVNFWDQIETGIMFSWHWAINCRQGFAHKIDVTAAFKHLFIIRPDKKNEFEESKTKKTEKVLRFVSSILKFGESLIWESSYISLIR